jgi:hypothetical protein
MIVIQFSLHDDLVFEKASVQHSYDKVESILSKRDDVCHECAASQRSSPRIGIFVVMGGKNTEFMFLLSKK